MFALRGRKMHSLVMKCTLCALESTWPSVRVQYCISRNKHPDRIGFQLAKFALRNPKKYLKCCTMTSRTKSLCSLCAEMDHDHCQFWGNYVVWSGNSERKSSCRDEWKNAIILNKDCGMSLWRQKAQDSFQVLMPWPWFVPKQFVKFPLHVPQDILCSLQTIFCY